MRGLRVELRISWSGGPADDVEVPLIGPLDLVLALDVTGSMVGALASVRSGLAEIIDAVERTSEGDYRLALVTFRDTVAVAVPMAEGNAAAVRAALQAQRASAGADLPEASDEALALALATPWRSAAARIVVLVTDAPPGGLDDVHEPSDVLQVRALAQQAADARVRIAAVFVPTAGDYAEQRALWQDVALRSRGVFVETDRRGAGLAAAIVEIIETRAKAS